MELNEIIKKVVLDKISEIHTSLPAKIERYDPEEMRADVVLLAKKELENEKVNIPPILDCPVSHFKAGPFIIRPPYQKGDKVSVIFSEKALDKLLITGEPEDPQHKRRFSYDDAIVTQGLKIEQEEDYPNEELKSLYICNLEKNVKFIMQPEGNIKIIDDKNGTELIFDVENEGNIIIKLANMLFLGSENANEGVPLGDSLKTWLDNHTHPGDSGGVTGPPNSSSPKPSKDVMVE